MVWNTLPYPGNSVDISYADFNDTDGLKITSGDVTDSGIYISQGLEAPISDMVGFWYTLSFCVDGDTVFSGSEYMDASHTSMTVVSHFFNVTFGMPDIFNSGSCSVNVKINRFVNNTLSWVKLERGGQFTGFVHPDPVFEMIRCKRYYRRIRLYDTVIYIKPDNGYEPGHVRITINMPDVLDMRVIPSVTYPYWIGVYKFCDVARSDAEEAEPLDYFPPDDHLFTASDDGYIYINISNPYYNWSYDMGAVVLAGPTKHPGNYVSNIDEGLGSMEFILNARM
jgi:hypothetical protein